MLHEIVARPSLRLRALQWCNRAVLFASTLFLGEWALFGVFRCPFVVPFVELPELPGHYLSRAGSADVLGILGRMAGCGGPVWQGILRLAVPRAACEPGARAQSFPLWPQPCGRGELSLGPVSGVGGGADSLVCSGAAARGRAYSCGRILAFCMAYVEACLSHVGLASAYHLGRAGVGAGCADVLVPVCLSFWRGAGGCA